MNLKKWPSFIPVLWISKLYFFYVTDAALSITDSLHRLSSYFHLSAKSVPSKCIGDKALAPGELFCRGKTLWRLSVNLYLVHIFYFVLRKMEAQSNKAYQWIYFRNLFMKWQSKLQDQFFMPVKTVGSFPPFSFFAVIDWSLLYSQIVDSLLGE